MLKLQVRDFKVVENANIAVDGFTLLKGESGAGKSSIISALFNATQNRFSSRNVRHGTEFATIRLGWSDQKDVLGVQRSVSGGSPVMVLGDNKWSKLRRQVPSEVEKYNNFGILTVGAEKYYLNFYEQFQKPLLKEFSQRRVMEILSASQAMDEHSMIHYALLKEREQNRGAVNNLDAVLSQQKAKLSQVKFEIKEKSLIVSELTKCKEKTMDLISRHETLLELIKKYDSLQQALLNIDSVKTGIEKLSIIGKQIEIRDNLIQKRDRIDVLINHMRSASSNIEQIRTVSAQINTLSRLNKEYEKAIPLKRREANLNILKTLLIEEDRVIQELNGIHPELSQLGKISKAMNEKTELNKVKSVTSALIYHMDVFKSTRDRIKEIDTILTQDLCPLCNHKLTP